MHSINFILISPRHVINKSYGEQPCAVKTLCISEKQPYAVGQPCAATHKDLICLRNSLMLWGLKDLVFN